MFSNDKQWEFKLKAIDNEITIELIENSIESIDKTIINRFNVLDKTFSRELSYTCLIKYKVLLIQN